MISSFRHRNMSYKLHIAQNCCIVEPEYSAPFCAFEEWGNAEGLFAEILIWVGSLKVKEYKWSNLHKIEQRLVPAYQK